MKEETLKRLCNRHTLRKCQTQTNTDYGSVINFKYRQNTLVMAEVGGVASSWEYI
jgi:hypothetical protein